MPDNEIIIDFKCVVCGKSFKSKQGSKSQLCKDCLWERTNAPKPRKEEVKE